jgi:hypothetical protein
MRNLTPQGQQAIAELAHRYGFSTDAVMTALRALTTGKGAMAQFSHPEMGGGTQWMQGGMTLVGDLFNNALRARVDGLCTELSGLLATQPVFAPPAPQPQPPSEGAGNAAGLFVPAGDSGAWWPGELGEPSASGSQNGLRYAVFPTPRRLAIDIDGQITVYDTLNHHIGSVGQQQGYGTSLTFTSQYGTVRVDDLPVVSGSPQGQAAPPDAETGDVFARIERLAELHRKGILSDEEFSQKKAELLSRV